MQVGSRQAFFVEIEAPGIWLIALLALSSVPVPVATTRPFLSVILNFTSAGAVMTTALRSVLGSKWTELRTFPAYTSRVLRSR